MLQQNLNSGIDGRVDEVGRILLQVILVLLHIYKAARCKPLLIARLVRMRDFDKRGSLRGESVGLRRRNMREHGCALQERIEVRGDRADLLNGCVPAASAVVSASADANTCTLDATRNALTAGHASRQAVSIGDAAQRSTTLLPVDLPLLNQRAVAIHLEPEIILDHQRDGILNSEIKLARSDQLVQACGVRQPRGRSNWPDIGSDNRWNTGVDWRDRNFLSGALRNDTEPRDKCFGITQLQILRASGIF